MLIFVMNEDDLFDAVLGVESSVVHRKVRIGDLLTENSYENFLKQSKPAKAGNVCAICLASFEDGERATMTNCGHFYHPVCMWEWIKSQCERGRCAKCPSCNKILFAPILNRRQFERFTGASSPAERRCCSVM